MAYPSENKTSRYHHKHCHAFNYEHGNECEMEQS